MPTVKKISRRKGQRENYIKSGFMYNYFTPGFSLKMRHGPIFSYGDTVEFYYFFSAGTKLLRN